MNAIRNYVERTFARVPDSKRKEEMMREVIESMENNANRLINEGARPEDAANRAIVEFGDLSELIDELRGGAESGRKRGLSVLLFSIIGALAIIGLMLFINLYYSPNSVWWVFPAFGILWWPLAVFFFADWRKKK